MNSPYLSSTHIPKSLVYTTHTLQNNNEDFFSIQEITLSKCDLLLGRSTKGMWVSSIDPHTFGKLVNS